MRGRSWLVAQSPGLALSRMGASPLRSQLKRNNAHETCPAQVRWIPGDPADGQTQAKGCALLEQVCSFCEWTLQLFSHKLCLAACQVPGGMRGCGNGSAILACLAVWGGWFCIMLPSVLGDTQVPGAPLLPTLRAPPEWLLVPVGDFKILPAFQQGPAAVAVGLS